MPESCEFLEKRGFFINYRGNSKVVTQGWIDMYCEDKDKSDRCERKKVRQQTGSPPADNMAPTGILL